MMFIQDRHKKLVEELAQVTDQEARYKTIIDYGKKLVPLDEMQRQDKFLVQGCMSRAWLIPEFKDGKVYFSADSEAAIVKGIVAILLEIFSGSTPQEILQFDSNFLKELGIAELLSMNRRNGLAGMIKQIKLYATVFGAMGK